MQIKHNYATVLLYLTNLVGNAFTVAKKGY